MKLLAVFAAAIALLSAADSQLGKPLTLKRPVPIETLLAKPASYLGKTVRVTGKITAVCQEMGCWMYLADAQGRKIRIKVNDGEIVFPKDGAGRIATAEGVFMKMTPEQIVEQAQDEAESSNKPFDPASVKTGTAEYQIQGTGAVIK